MSPESYLILAGLTALLLGTIQNCICQNDNVMVYETCSRPFKCGDITEIGYPFWDGDRPQSCGGNLGFQLNCRDDNTLHLNISSLSYRVLEILYGTQTLRVARDDLHNNLCDPLQFNTTLNLNLFGFSPAADEQNITLYYRCPIPVLPSPALSPFQFGCPNSLFTTTPVVQGNNFSLSSCETIITVPANRTVLGLVNQITTLSETPRLLEQALDDGFLIRWYTDNFPCGDCDRSVGFCGRNPNPGSYSCYCRDGLQGSSCIVTTTGDEGGSNRNTSTTRGRNIGLFIAGGFLACIGVGWLVFYYRKHSRKKCRLGKQDQESKQNIDKFLLNHGSLAPKRYHYNDIKKITKSFSDKLGRGGYGTVYKGELPDGQLVAVKVLSETNDNGAEDFVNEVSSISRTSHVNIVQGNKRALVYEFMPNKSLDNFISKNRSLGADKLYEIAVGVARGLEYLHRGCNTRIVHFDIKPQNILLDKDMCPKISDFGLAKLFKEKQSVVSMIGARGTIGYIAPEVFSRSFGVVSHKSDVYSYGMMLLVLGGAKGIAEVEAVQSSENYFLDKIYEHVLLKKGKLHNLMMTEENEETTRKMLLIGVWCIQTAPSERPSMTKVVEMLQGSVGSIQIPPKPFLSSPKLSAPQISSSFSGIVEIKHSTVG